MKPVFLQAMDATPTLTLPLVGGGDLSHTLQGRRLWIPAFAGMTVEDGNDGGSRG